MTTASQLPLLSRCAPSAVLAHVQRGELRQLAGRGADRHAYMDDVVAYGREVALERAPAEHVEMLAEIDVGRLLTDVGIASASAAHPEIAFALPMPAARGARVLGQRIERAYADHGSLTDELAGSTDLVLLDVGGELTTVVDWKSAGTVDPAPQNLQLLFAAVCAADIYQRPVAVAIGYLDRAHVDGPHLLDDVDIAAARAEIRRVWLAAQRPGGLVEGEHCRYCAALPMCPAKLAGAAAITAQRPWIEALARGEGGEMTAQRAGALKQQLDRVRPMVARAWDYLREYGEEYPIETPDGRTWRTQAEETETLDPAVAEAVVREMGGEAPRMRTSVDALYDALRGSTPRGHLGTRVREALAAIRARGGTATATRRKLKEIKT